MSPRALPLVAGVLGAALALTLPPHPQALSVFVLGLFFWLVAALPRRAFIGAVFWFAFGLHAVHLWWLTDFMGNLLGIKTLGFLALPLFFLEASFYALMAALISWRPLLSQGRLWALAGGWVLLEWLRFLGPFSFPWPTLGYSLLDSPLIQMADIGGVLLGSLFVTVLATLMALAMIQKKRSLALPFMMLWGVALLYGNYQLSQDWRGTETRTATVVSANIDAFSKATGLSPQTQLNAYLPAQPSSHMLILPETAAYRPLLPLLPTGIYGVYDERLNGVVSWKSEANREEGLNTKAKPVPFGEFFPLRDELPGVWQMIEQAVGFSLHSTPPAREVHPLPLDGISYGAYICYDSVFPWVARELSNKGANVLVNVSNDGWYSGWGVAQHFAMGRVRAIENRRWLLRSVNLGVAGSVQPTGEVGVITEHGQLDVTFQPRTGRTLYGLWGDALVVGLAMGCFIWGISRRDRQDKRKNAGLALDNTTENNL